MHELTDELNEALSESALQTEIFLDSEDRDRLVWIAEAGLQVESQSSFFLWSQGALQMLIPHEILLCGMRLNPAKGTSLQFSSFSSCRYFKAEHFEAVCEPKDGLVSQLLARWLRFNKPCALLPEESEATDRALIAAELKNVVAHGVRGPDGEAAAFFTFSRTPIRLDGRGERIMELLAPVIYTTYMRVLVNNLSGEGVSNRVPNLVSQREVEILGLIKEGRTTAHIANSLGLSPFTVKNHVQNILRKLGARTRSHAVAQAINMGLLPHW